QEEKSVPSIVADGMDVFHGDEVQNEDKPAASLTVANDAVAVADADGAEPLGTSAEGPQDPSVGHAITCTTVSTLSQRSRALFGLGDHVKISVHELDGLHWAMKRNMLKQLKFQRHFEQ
ncbi:hypothetical protein Vretifemale_17226, partial [Volvox reticuliferus]